MLNEILIKIYNRDLEKLKDEINSYHHEKNLWIINRDITNSAGNLCLHIVGNLNAFIGTVLGNTNYKRQRDLEFSLKDVQRSTLIQQIDATIVVVETTLRRLSQEDLIKEYPNDVFKEPMTTEYFLVHLNTHLAYHLGQINYHRRILDN